LCEPIDGLDGAFIAECLGLDPASYRKAAAHQEAEEDETIVDDIMYFKYVSYQGEVVGTRPIGRLKKYWLEGVQDVLHRHRIKTSINKRAVQANVMKLRDAQVECQDRARWRKVCNDLQ